MNKKYGTSKDAAGKLVRGIKRKTRKHYSAEEKIRIVLAGLGAKRASQRCAVARELRKACITLGQRNSLKLGRTGWRVTRRDKRHRRKSKNCDRNPLR